MTYTNLKLGQFSVSDPLKIKRLGDYVWFHALKRETCYVFSFITYFVLRIPMIYACDYSDKEA